MAAHYFLKLLDIQNNKKKHSASFWRAPHEIFLPPVVYYLKEDYHSWFAFDSNSLFETECCWISVSFTNNCDVLHFIYYCNWVNSPGRYLEFLSLCFTELSQTVSSGTYHTFQQGPEKQNFKLIACLLYNNDRFSNAVVIPLTGMWGLMNAFG